MKYKLKMFFGAVFLGSLIMLPLILLAWVGSDMGVIIDYPSDNSSITAPVTFRGKVWNSTQGIDYYVIEYWCDVNGNGQSDAGDTGSSWVVLESISDLTVLRGNNISSYEKGSKTIFQQNNNYLVRVCAVDLNGDTSADTTVLYMSGEGDNNTWLDSEVVNFSVRKGITPSRPR